MWIFTPSGFVSIVKDNLIPGHMLLRFRTRRHADTIREEVMDSSGSVPTFNPEDFQVFETPQADYLFKLSVREDMFLWWLNTAGEAAAGYTNFKAACMESPAWDGQYSALHDVWSVMFDEQQ